MYCYCLAAMVLKKNTSGYENIIIPLKVMNHVIAKKRKKVSIIIFN